MAITDAIDITTFDNDNDTNGSGVELSDTWDTWRKKVNGVINALGGVSGIQYSNIYGANVDTGEASFLVPLTSANISNPNNNVQSVSGSTTTADLLPTTSATNYFTLATGTYEFQIDVSLQGYLASTNSSWSIAVNRFYLQKYTDGVWTDFIEGNISSSYPFYGSEGQNAYSTGVVNFETRLRGYENVNDNDSSNRQFRVVVERGGYSGLFYLRVFNSNITLRKYA